MITWQKQKEKGLKSNKERGDRQHVTKREEKKVETDEV